MPKHIRTTWPQASSEQSHLLSEVCSPDLIRLDGTDNRRQRQRQTERPPPEPSNVLQRFLSLHYLEWRNSMNKVWMNEWTDTSLRYSTATEECVSNDFFRHLLDDSPASYFDIAAQPILEYRWIDSYTQLSLRTQFKVATVYSIHTQSMSWCSTGLVPNVLPRRDEGSGKPCAVDRAS